MWASALYGAAMGFLLARLLMVCLFWPARPVTLGPVRVQGLVPARRERWLGAAASALAAALGDGADLWALLDTAQNREALYRGLRGAVRERTEAWPAFPLRRQLAARLEDTVIREVAGYLNRLSRNPTSVRGALRGVRIPDLIRERLLAIDAKALERELQAVGRRELAGMAWVAAGAGFLIGAGAPLVAAWLAHV